MSEQMLFSIVLPCYNEADNLPLLAERFAVFYPQYSFELILVNNGSTDHTATVLNSLQAHYAFIKLVQIVKNIGYGHGIHSGLLTAVGEFVAFSHADVQTPPEDLFKAVDLLLSLPIEQRTQVLIKGFRVNKTTDLMTRGLEFFCFLFTGYHLSDINGQPKLFHRRFFAGLTNPPLDFSYDAWILLKSKQAGQKLLCFDVYFGQRIHGLSKSAANIFLKWRTIRQFFYSLYRIAGHEKADPHNLPAQLWRFLQTGLLTNILNYLAFIFTLYFFYCPYLLASGLGFISGFVAGFFLNRYYTFNTQEEKTTVIHSLWRFFVVNMLSLGLNLLTVGLGVESGGFPPELAQVFGIIISAIFNFFGCRLFVFK